MSYVSKLLIGYILTFFIFSVLNKEFHIREKLREKLYPSRNKRYFLKYTLVFIAYVLILTTLANIAGIPADYLYVFSGAILGAGFYIIPYPNAHLVTQPEPKRNINKKKINKKNKKK